MPADSNHASPTLELPNGETVTPEDVFLYNNYPYRVRFPDGSPSGNRNSEPSANRDGEAPGNRESDSSGNYDGDAPASNDPEFFLSPLYWGGGEMDIPFRDREALVEQWGSESRGTLTETEWEGWLREARHDDRFGDDELDAIARELPTSGGSLVARLRDALRL